MKIEPEKILHFNLKIQQGLSVTHGYNITNAFPVHFHTTYNLGIIENGERELFYRGTPNSLKQDDVFVIEPFEPHSCKAIKTTHSYKIISFTLNKAPYFPQLIIDNTHLADLLRKFHSSIGRESNTTKQAILFEEILAILSSIAEESKVGLCRDTCFNRINQAKQFIEKYCRQEISLKEMADKACLSEFHFSRFFHKQYGLSPYAYYLVCKMKKAQHILVKQKSVTAAAYETGFFDQSHFVRLFKKHIGITPGKYLKDNREETRDKTRDRGQETRDK